MATRDQSSANDWFGPSRETREDSKVWTGRLLYGGDDEIIIFSAGKLVRNNWRIKLRQLNAIIGGEVMKKNKQQQQPKLATRTEPDSENRRGGKLPMLTRQHVAESRALYYGEWPGYHDEALTLSS
ncbi:hypothetical protein RRG08_003092 [Elysia crispata]|uniref:Uncharacterized protein n=1 Tax=Elysia crispata TaxID=231223 RepID=A0AAE1EAV9_9GAST|nr:hypothetical protein RRG08_003092 [Elysia crispata]